MSAPKFTPGPWNVAHERDGYGGFSWQVKEFHDMDAVALVACERRNDDERQANARLIAAAPELYAALRDMLRSHDLTCQGPECGIVGVDRARAALAKAEGLPSASSRLAPGEADPRD